MTDEITNWYNKVPKKFKKKTKNPNYDQHLMDLPFRALIVGKTGSMKTNLLLEIISRMGSTFDLIVVCCKKKDEQLYNMLEEKLDDKVVFFEGIEEIPDVAVFEEYGEITLSYSKNMTKKPQILIVFDDLMLEKDQKKITEYFIRGRKVAGGISCVYLTQSYYKTPKTIRLQCDYIFLKKISSNTDIHKIIDEFNLGVDKNRLVEVYSDITKNKSDCMTIDTVKDEYKFRKNFLLILDLS